MEKTNTTVKKTAEESAIEVLRAKANKDIENCSAEIGQVLKKYGCTLDPVTIIRNGVAPVIEFGIKKIG